MSTTGRKGVNYNLSPQWERLSGGEKSRMDYPDLLHLREKNRRRKSNQHS